MYTASAEQQKLPSCISECACICTWPAVSAHTVCDYILHVVGKGKKRLNKFRDAKGVKLRMKKIQYAIRFCSEHGTHCMQKGVILLK